MQLSSIDWIIISAFFLITLVIGIMSAKKSGKSTAEFFLSGRNMPWWLLGVSMVATTFSADTPNLVTDIIRKDGIAGNWVWWAFCLTGMLTVFVYARLWRRSGVLTDLEFYELRYSGKEAAMLRGFRAIYLGVFFNIMIMATVLLAGIKIGSVMLGLSAIETVLYSSIITVVYTSLGGLRGVILTDFFQFGIAMVGIIWAAIVVVNLPEVGGMTELFNHPNVEGKLDFIPDFNNTNALLPLFIIPLAVQWWNVWYPGAEPGGGGYVAQRMLAAKNEKHAVGATLFFNIAHYAFRPWPWILIALASLIVFPDLDALKNAFPNVADNVINDDLAFSAMLTYLPKGLLGLVLASLIAAFMSTISTHLNWGSSYVVHDFYKRFIDESASEKTLVNMGRISTVVLMLFSGILALYLTNALQAFNILLQIGAGTGLIFILRWFWWRINAYSEITAMIVSFLVAFYFEFGHEALGFDAMESYEKLITGIIITTIAWLIATFVTRPTAMSTLVNFYKKVHPGKSGWAPVIETGLAEGDLQQEEIKTGEFALKLSAMFVAVFLVYAILFGTGYLLYGNTTNFLICLAVAISTGMYLISVWNRITK